MQCVILAAGLGTRMGELTKKTPKALLKIDGKTILEHDLEALPEEIDETVLVVGYLGEQIREAIGKQYELPPTPSLIKEGERGSSGRKRIAIKYVEQKELKGTAHALFACKDLLEGRFLVIHGDDLYSKGDLEELIKKPLGILVWELEKDDLELGYQAVVKTDSEGNLSDIMERQPARKGTLVNTGAYALNKSFFDYPMISAGTPENEFGLPQTMLQMVRDGAKFEIVRARWWHKVATAEDLSSQLPSPT